jgi:hypothetical protein
MASFSSSSDAGDEMNSGAPLPGAGSGEVQKLLAVLRSPTASDGVREQEAVARITAAIVAAPTRIDARRNHMSVRRIPMKVAVASAAVILFGGTAAAAATGSLPDSAQHAVSAALGHVDVHVPDPNDHTADHSSDHGSKTTPVGVDPNGPAKHGLCTAWAARNQGDGSSGRSGDSTAFTNLQGAAHDLDQTVKEFCAPELAKDSTGQAGDHGRSGDHGKSGESHGRPSTSTPPVSTPNDGGLGTGSGASGSADGTGVDHAAPGAGSGSANATGHGPGH